MSRPAEAVLNTLPRANALLMNGFTTIRNLGDPTLTTYALRDAINKGIVPGPRMFVSEVQISVAGGDFDSSSWDVRSDVEKFVTNRGNCSGVVECIKAVREEVHRGADVVKFRQAGLPAENPKVAMVESPEEIKAIIDTAHQLNRRVAVHVVGSPAFLHAVIEAGADTIQQRALGQCGDRDDEEARYRVYAHAARRQAHRLSLPRRRARGWQGLSCRRGPLPFSAPIWGFSDLSAVMKNLRCSPRPRHAAGAGAAQRDGQRRRRARRVGERVWALIAPGKTADVIAMHADPLTHIDQLAEPGKVSFVMKEGKVFKDER